MNLDELTSKELIFPRLDCTDRATLLQALANRIVDRGYQLDPAELYRRLLERERLGSTGVGSGVAIPHCKMEGLQDVLMAVGLTETAIDFGALDEKPVRLFFLVISPTNSPAAHLQCLAAISKWVKVEERVQNLIALDDPAQIFEQLRNEG